MTGHEYLGLIIAHALQANAHSLPLNTFDMRSDEMRGDEIRRRADIQLDR